MDIQDMVDLARPAKSGSDWSDYDLLCYHITSTSLPPQEFFQQGANPSLKGLDPVLINSPLDAIPHNLSVDTYRFLTCLDLAMESRSNRETAREDLARELLHVAGFVEHGSTLLTNHKIPLHIGGESNQVAQPNVCLLDQQSMILLVLQVEKINEITLNYYDPEPQVIAEAIAVYQHNNRKREEMGLSKLDTMTVPCITLHGTCPTFQLVPVTQQLSDAVSTGQWREAETKVIRSVTVGHKMSWSEGMEIPEYRRIALQRMVAFKVLAKSHWETFLAK